MNRGSRKYEIGGTPTLMLMDVYGNELFRFTGSLTVERVVQLLNELPGDISRINQRAAVLAADKDRFDALDALGRELRAEGFYVASNRYFARALRAREAARVRRQGRAARRTGPQSSRPEVVRGGSARVR